MDDGLIDNIVKVVFELENEKIKFFKLDKNRGKGYVLNYGIKLVMKNVDIIGFLDGDLGSFVKEVEKLIVFILNGEVDVIIVKFFFVKRKGGLGFVKGLVKNFVFEMIGVELDVILLG